MTDDMAPDSSPIDTGLLSHLDIDTAMQRVYRNIQTGPIPNRLDATIIKRYPNEVRDRVSSLLEDTSMDWANGAARYFDLPKQDGLVRPICYVDIDVAVAYQALVDATSKVIEPYISRLLDDKVLSCRIRSSTSHTMFKPPSDTYRRFIEIQHKIANDKTFDYCLRLDIANYYERIYQHRLQHLLETRGVPGVITGSLCRLLRKFTNGDSHGIPQGLWASDYLGNTYLLYLDAFLLEKGIYAIRYVDDYRVFCDSERDAQIVLKECGQMLRSLGLNIQPQKTSIVTTDQLDPELQPLTERFFELRQNIKGLRDFESDYGADAWEDAFEEMDFESDGETQASTLSDADIAEFERLWTDAVDQEDKKQSILSFALSGLRVGASATAEQYILDNLEEFPHLASVSGRYLSGLGFKKETAERIVDFLTSGACIHEWQQMWLLEYFRQPGAEVELYLSRLEAFLDDANQHPLVRGLTAELIAMKGSEANGEHLKRLFTNEADQKIRRQLLLGFKLLPVAEKNQAISYLPANDWVLKLLGRAIRSK